MQAGGFAAFHIKSRSFSLSDWLRVMSSSTFSCACLLDMDFGVDSGVELARLGLRSGAGQEWSLLVELWSGAGQRVTSKSRTGAPVHVVAPRRTPNNVSDACK